MQGLCKNVKYCWLTQWSSATSNVTNGSLNFKFNLKLKVSITEWHWLISSYEREPLSMCDHNHWLWHIKHARQCNESAKRWSWKTLVLLLKPGKAFKAVLQSLQLRGISAYSSAKCHSCLGSVRSFSARTSCKAWSEWSDQQANQPISAPKQNTLSSGCRKVAGGCMQPAVAERLQKGCMQPPLEGSDGNQCKHQTLNHHQKRCKNSSVRVRGIHRWKPSRPICIVLVET